MEDTPIVFFNGPLKRKTGFFGMWADCYGEVVNDELVVYNDIIEKVVINRILIQASTKVSIDESDKCVFVIKFSDNSKVMFKAASSELAFQWIISLKSAVVTDKAVTMDNFYILSVLGRGYFGKVMLCQRKGTNNLYAIKTVQKNKLQNLNKVHTIFAERNILLNMRHPFIVKLAFAFQSSSKYYLGMEYVPGGELFRLIQKTGGLPIDQVRIYAAEIGLALQFLHQNGIVYRDLKPENILIDKDGHIKLTDFGLSKTIDQSSTSTFCGTVAYLAPEIIRRTGYGLEIDWWAYGCVIYELFFGTTPFFDDSRSRVFQRIQNDVPEFPSDFDPIAADFIKQLLEKNPAKRATFDSLLDHEFWNGLDFEDVLRKTVQPAYVPIIDDISIPDNFDDEYTMEVPHDSFALPGGPNESPFRNFSYMGSLFDHPCMSPGMAPVLIPQFV